MFATSRRPGIGATAATGLLFDSEIRSAAVEAARPVARLGFRIGRRYARRRARQRLAQTVQTISTIAALVAQYGPQLAEQLGLVEPPKPPHRRAAPVLVAGSVVAVGAYYLLEPKHGADHRRQVQRLFVR